MDTPREDRDPVSRDGGTRDGGTLDHRTVDALLAGRPVVGEPGLVRALALLRTAADEPVAAPSAALALLLAEGCTPVAAAVPGRLRGWTAKAAVIVAAGLGGLLTAATADALPPAVQGAVADVVDAVTPYELPRPTRPPAPPVTTPTPLPVGPAAPTDTREDEPPHVEAPELQAPELEAPGVEAPEVEAPEADDGGRRGAPEPESSTADDSRSGLTTGPSGSDGYSSDGYSSDGYSSDASSGTGPAPEGDAGPTGASQDRSGRVGDAMSAGPEPD